jgi:hypothetical protein
MTESLYWGAARSVSNTASFGRPRQTEHSCPNIIAWQATSAPNANGCIPKACNACQHYVWNTPLHSQKQPPVALISAFTSSAGVQEPSSGADLDRSTVCVLSSLGHFCVLVRQREVLSC